MTSSPSGQKCVVDGLLGTVGNEDVGFLVVEAVVAFQFVGDGLAQRGRAGHGRVVRVVVVDGVHTGLLGRFGRVEVGLADAQADDVDALGLQFAALVGHG